MNRRALSLKRVERSEGKLIMSFFFKPSTGKERVRACKDYVIGREITTVQKIGVNHVTYDVRLPKLLNTRALLQMLFSLVYIG